MTHNLDDSSSAPTNAPDLMTAWTTGGDGIENLAASRVPVPQPGRGEVLVKITALSVNYRDLMVINGMDGWKPARQVVPVSDAVGTVVGVGEGVDRFDLGDRISAMFLPKWRSGALTRETYVDPVGGPVNRGMLAEYVVLDQDAAVAAPRTLDDEHAAALPVAAVTAWHAVARRSRVQPGETVLIHGTGGVSLFALQFVLALGGIPIITSSSDQKLDRARRLGAAHTVNYSTTPDIAAEVMKITAGDGVDHVMETIGGENLNQSLRAVKLGGTISFIGLIAGLAAKVNTYEFVTKNVTIHGIETGSRDMFEEMVRFIDEHRIVPVLDSIYSIHQIGEALQHLAQGRHLGKIVITEKL
ncbi:NAD(P)-dependent alcohol dehydrogenase [Arthrobacter sp. CAN_C5]|uniref:zinc-dependent alcohol dehydrogenase family protein n=1 Tax=Arthrobacter sp. CAN_C5 TaxID=2760706 RepID=UPI001AE5432B|nr:NAD(P)-dependent alcohol dehydrogenase [Arthrobacter sp. CAN_C5]MBP2216963.1 NADPH:quinone reductase-like Zn-dependent oxidoreductase [Arthrobacter sp. CAN_C5]